MLLIMTFAEAFSKEPSAGAFGNEIFMYMAMSCACKLVCPRPESLAASFQCYVFFRSMFLFCLRLGPSASAFRRRFNSNPSSPNIKFTIHIFVFISQKKIHSTSLNTFLSKKSLSHPIQSISISGRPSNARAPEPPAAHPQHWLVDGHRLRSCQAL